MWRLGVVGTYLGDYFGILMEERVTAFPFNVMDDPMCMCECECARMNACACAHSRAYMRVLHMCALLYAFTHYVLATSISTTLTHAHTDNGSTMVFLGTAVGAMSGVGVILSAWVFLLYRIALVFEGDFTARIYADAAKSAKGKGKKSAPGTRSVSASPARKSARMKRE